MRVFEVLQSTAISRIRENKTWYRNLYEPMVDIGCDVILFPAEKAFSAMRSKNKEKVAEVSDELLKTIKKEHTKKPIDLFFAYLMDNCIDSQVILEIKKMGIPTCNFSCNNIHQFYLTENLSKKFDLNLYAEKEAKQSFDSIGATSLWWPMSSNPKYFKPVECSFTYDMSFVGANYATRARYVHHLLENNIDIHAFGPNWLWGARTKTRSFLKRFKFLSQTMLARSNQKRAMASGLLFDHDFRVLLGNTYAKQFHSPISDEELIKLYSSSKLSLGILDVYDKHNPTMQIKRHLHLREFEAPMCGACYCTGYTDELAEMFEPEKEVITYRDSYELLDKVKYYLAQPADRVRIREAARKRALADHTPQQRFKTLFTYLGMKY
jgi:spore maturation protein CgeB